MSAPPLLAIADASLDFIGTTRAARLQPQAVILWWASLPVCARPRCHILTFRSSDVLYLRMGAESLIMGAPFPYSQVPAQLQSIMAAFLKLLLVSKGDSCGPVEEYQSTRHDQNKKDENADLPCHPLGAPSH